MENNSTCPPSAPSPIYWLKERHAFPLQPTILALCGIPIVILLAVAFLNIWLLGPSGVAPSPSSPPPVRFLLLSQLAIYVPLIAYLLAVVPPLAGCSIFELDKLGIRKPTKRDILAGLTGALTMWFGVAVASSVLTAVTHDHHTEAAVEVLRNLRTPEETLAFTAIAVLFAPMVEEFSFRIFLFNAISAHTSVPVGAIISGILFGIVHGPGITVIIPLALGGIILAAIYAKTGCYWSNVITHALFNAAGVVAVLVFHVTD